MKRLNRMVQAFLFCPCFTSERRKFLSLWIKHRFQMKYDLATHNILVNFALTRVRYSFMIKNIIACLLVFAAVNVGFSQSKWTESADDEFIVELYEDAIRDYKRGYILEPPVEKARIIYQIAECYRMINNIPEAEKWYKMSIDAKHSNPRQYFYYAECKRISGAYEEAINMYEKYQGMVPSDDEPQDKIAACKVALDWQNLPTKFNVENVGAINSEKMDFAPDFIDKRGLQLAFATARPGASGDNYDSRSGQNFTDIFMATKDKKGNWSEPIKFDNSGTINTYVNEGTPRFNAKKNVIYFTRCPMERKEKLGCDIYKANYTAGKITDLNMVPLKGPGEEEFTVGHPTVNKKETILIFSSDLPGGIGGRDLWMIQYDKKLKEWSRPKNLGTKINTEGDEAYPFLDLDNNLYFSSTGHTGLGGYDIFKAGPVAENKWENPENLRLPVNSSADDYGIVVSKSGEGYFSSSRPGGVGSDDIYSFKPLDPVFALQGTVFDKGKKIPVAGATVKLIGSDGKFYETTTNEDGEYEFAENGSERYVQKEISYSIEVSAPDYLLGRDQFTTVGVATSTLFEIDFLIQSAKANEVISLPEIYYELNKWDLRPESYPSLDSLAETLKQNETFVIELGAHTDARGDDASNMELSQKRAESVVSYLTGKGIDGQRLVAKGYGETEPLIRVEDIEAMSADEQEAAHQKNRRTEFKILRKDFVPGASAAGEDTEN